MSVQTILRILGVFLVTQLLLTSDITVATAPDLAQVPPNVVQIRGDTLVTCAKTIIKDNLDFSRVIWCPERFACYTYTGNTRPELFETKAGCTCFQQPEQSDWNLPPPNSITALSSPKDEQGWITVFKAVAGSGRSVRSDFLSGGHINSTGQEAKNLDSDLPFRDHHILDRWEDVAIDLVKVEIFEAGVRRSWFVFDGYGTTISDWFSKEALMDSPYQDLTTMDKSVRGAFFSIDGHGKPDFARRFYINRSYNSCPRDCGYLVVVDPFVAGECPWDIKQERPYFIYGKKLDSCSITQSEDSGVGDRFIISVTVEE